MKKFSGRLLFILILLELLYGCQHDEDILMPDKLSDNVSAKVYSKSSVDYIILIKSLFDKENSDPDITEDDWSRLAGNLAKDILYFPKLTDILDELARSGRKIKVKIDPYNPTILQHNASACWNVDLIVLKYKDYLSYREVMLHEMLHQLQYINYKDNYMMNKYERNLEFEVCLLLDLWIMKRDLNSGTQSSYKSLFYLRNTQGLDDYTKQEKEDYVTFLAKICERDISKEDLNKEFNHFAEIFKAYQDAKYDSSYTPSLVWKYWLSIF